MVRNGNSSPSVLPIAPGAHTWNPAPSRSNNPIVWSSSASVSTAPRSGLSRNPGPGASRRHPRTWRRTFGETFSGYQV
ncbi:MAG TPA: hypothetical protein VJT49_06910 [Amycolatopsis sp.]|nr:hypothetical protein [Amycolatopsis sp.]HKS44837.1 hypothetical protein [Amycolatopsis sp.]